MKRLSTLVTAVAATAVLGLAACSPPGSDDGTAAGNGEGAGSPAEGESVTVEYGSFSTGTSARQVLVAEELGYFEDEGIDLEITSLQSTAGLASLLASGEVHVAMVAYQPALNALAAGIDIRPLATVQALQEGMQTVWAREDSGIDGLEDLEGTSFGIASVGGYGEALLRESMVQEGLDPDTVTFVELAPPETEAALERGEIDAAHLPSPFAGAIILNEDSPLVQVYDFYDTESLQGLPQGGLWVNGRYAEENAEVLDRFMAAVERAAAEIDADPDADREFLQRVGNFSPELVETMPLEHWVGEVTAADLERVADLMIEHGMLEEGTVDVDDVVR